MDALVDVIELHAVYGFTTPIVIDLESVDSEWLDEHCDVVGFARSLCASRAMSARFHPPSGSGPTPGTAHVRGWSPPWVNTATGQCAIRGPTSRVRRPVEGCRSFTASRTP
jgi:hypothetical protein